MDKPFRINIISPEAKIYSGDIVSLIVPAKFGYWGILADHAPLVAELTHGKITVEEVSGQIKNFSVKSNGFIEVLKNNATVILESAVDIFS